MAFAPHTNDDITDSNGLPRLMGYFQVDGSSGFEYAARPADDRGGWAPEFDKLVYVSDGTRIARVLKTRAHVVIDETSDGRPVVETWLLRAHYRYA